MAALIAATAAFPGLGSSAALPDINTTRSVRGHQGVPSLYCQATRAVKLQRHAVVPLRVCHLEQADLWHCAGDVEKRVDPAKALKRGSYDRRGRLWLTRIDGDGQRLRADGLNLRGCCLQVFLVSRDKDDGRNVSREPEGCCSPDAPACTGHHGDGFDFQGM